MPSYSSTIEDYLKAIYERQAEGDGQAVGTAALAETLGVSQASVTGMLKKLAAASRPLIAYTRYRGVRLTARGEQAALEVVRHHRLLEAYLTTALGYSWDEVHHEAEALEHVISEDFEDRIADFLGHPETDPHGAPIPNRDGSLPPRREVRLTDLPVGRSAAVSARSGSRPGTAALPRPVGPSPAPAGAHDGPGTLRWSAPHPGG